MERGSPGRRDMTLQRHDGDSPVVSMKRLMQQLHEELDVLRQQQDALLRQFADQRRQDVEDRRWVKERLETLDRKVQEATALSSALNDSASAAAASANAAAIAAAAAVANRAPAAHSPGPLLKTSSFEFAHNTTRFTREGSSGAFGSVNLTSGILGLNSSSPLGAPSPLGLRGNRHRSGGGGGGGGEDGGDGLAVSLDSPRRRFQQPSSSSEGSDGTTSSSAMGRPAGRSAASRARSRGPFVTKACVATSTGEDSCSDVPYGRRGDRGHQLSVFAAGGAQERAVQDLAPTGKVDSRGAAAGAAAAAATGVQRGEAALGEPRSSLSTEPSTSLQEAMPSFATMPESLTSMDSSTAATIAGGNGGGGCSGPPAWGPQSLSTVSCGPSMRHGSGHGHGPHHHHYYHHSHSYGHGHGHHMGHSNSMGGASSRAGFPLTRNSHHGSGSGFGTVAMLFPTLRHVSSTDDLPAGTAGAVTAAAGVPPPSSPLHKAASGSSTPYAGFTGGAGAGGAPSLMHESLHSGSVSEPEAERVDAASTRHFKGISPRLVEIYHQRAEQSHWSLQRDSVQLLRAVNRRGSTDAMQRSTGLLRPSTAITAVANAAGGPGTGTGNATRMLLLHGGGGSSKAHDGGGGGGVGSGPEDTAGWVLLDPNYDHPPMLGDDDEYSKPMTLLDRVKLYSVGLIRPEGRTKWDLFILVLLVWVLFASPVIICFGLSGDAFTGDWVGIVELCVDAAFTFDIYLNFRTAYYDSKGYLVTERWRIARHYLKTWFLLDLVCIIPYDLITAGTMGFLSMLKLLRVMRVGKVMRMIRMYRLLRVIRLPRILERMEMFIDRGALQVMAFILSVCLLAHLSACIFYYMAFLDGLGPQTWVAAYGVQEADLATKYLTSLYWAFTTTATVGYGDITPKTDKEKIVAIFVMCVGVSLVGYVTSSITNIMAIKNAQQTNIAAKKQLVTDVLKSRSVPSELSRRVYNYFDYVSSKMIKREEAGLLAELPFKLRARLLTSFYADTLSRIPGVSRLPPHVLIELVTQLKPHFFVEGDIVTVQGDYVDALYLVSEGLLEVRTYMFPADVEPWRVFEAVHKDELRCMPYSVEGRLKPRYFFGQGGVLHGGVWPATVIARNCCELYTLDREGLEHMLAVQPELQDMLGIPRTPVPASVAHTAFVSGPGANALLPPADRAALTADFPLMDPAPQRGLMQSMLRSMGHIITGGLARASAAHYPNMPGSPTSPAAGGGGGGGGWVPAVIGGAAAEKDKGKGRGGGARSMLMGLMGWRKSGKGDGDGGGGADGMYGASKTLEVADDKSEPTSTRVPESRFSRFRPFGRRGGPRNSSVVQLLSTEEGSGLLQNCGDRSDVNVNVNGNVNGQQQRGAQQHQQQQPGATDTDSSFRV